MAFDIMTDDNMKDVYSNPAYPQFNEGRLTYNARNNIIAWNDADKSGISAENVTAVEAAVAKVEALLGETIVDQAAWNAADAELEKALVDAGVIADEAPTKVESALTVILKYLNKTVNIIFKNF